MAKRSIKNWVIQLLKFAFAFGIIGYLIVSGKLDLHSIWAALTCVKSVVPAVFLMFSNILISARRWWMLLSGQDIHVTYWEALKLTYIGAFFNTTPPGAVTGDMMKGYYTVKRQGQERKIAAFATILLDRIVGISGLIIVAGGSLALNVAMHNSSSSLAVKSLRIPGSPALWAGGNGILAGGL
jgi:hypothetical protein